MTGLPSGWARAALGDLVYTRSGNSKLIKGKLYPDPGPGRVAAFSATGQDVWCDLAEWEGDGIVLSAVGARCGKAFLAHDRWTAIANTHVLRPRQGVNVRFLWYLLNDENFWIRGGSAQPFVKIKDSKSNVVPLPPIPEQQRIVTAIEEHLSRLDAAEAAINRVRLRLSSFKTVAVDEVFSSLPRAELLLGEDLFSYVTSGSRGWAKYYASSGAAFIRVGNVPRSGIRLDLSDVQLVAPSEGAEGRRTKVKPGDLLITITADIGRVAVAPADLEEAYINQHVALARPREALNPEYLAWFVASSKGQTQLRGLQRGATKLGLGLEDIRALQFPIPPLAIQDDIASRLTVLAERLDVSVRDMKREVRRVAAVRRSILDAAFSGRLVPQDAGDEPASVLLDRIRADQAAAPPTKRARKAKTS